MGNGLFTRNYDNIMAMARFPFLNNDMSDPKFSIGEAFADGECVLKDKTGLIYTGAYNYYSGNAAEKCLPFASIYSNGAISTPTGGGYTSIYLGSNNTEETYDDFTLLSELTMYGSASTGYDLQYSAPVCSNAEYDPECKCWRKTINYTFIANRACTVGEMGFYFAGRPFVCDAKTFLVYRRAFENPYELVAGDTFRVDFTLVIPANPNQPMTVEVEAQTE